MAKGSVKITPQTIGSVKSSTRLAVRNKSQKILLCTAGQYKTAAAGRVLGCQRSAAAQGLIQVGLRSEVRLTQLNHYLARLQGARFPGAITHARQALGERRPGLLYGARQLPGLYSNQGKSFSRLQEPGCARAAGHLAVLDQNPAQESIFVCGTRGNLHEIEITSWTARVLGQEVGQSPGHPRTEVDSGRPQHDDNATGHVFASVLARTLHHGKGSAIAHGEALPGRAGYVQLARGGAVEHGVAGQDIAAHRGFLPGIDRDHAPTEALADVVVGFAG